jgi:SAM-dependent methyltransferase
LFSAYDHTPGLIKMGIIGGPLGYNILKWISVRRGVSFGLTGYMDGSAYANRSKLEVLLGPDIWENIKGKVVVDFGCGDGEEAVEMARRGAGRVIGVDKREEALETGRALAERAGVSDRCAFTTDTDQCADIIISLDSFEHFEDPALILRIMRRIIKPGGVLLCSFGPTWYHPLGGHGFSIFPYAHLIFTESAFMRWRADYVNDGAKVFREVGTGLNQMTIRRFKKIVAESQWGLESFEAVPIRRLRPLANRFTQEFTTAIVRCRLRPQSTSGGNKS